jgi:hypothetical protein
VSAGPAGKVGSGLVAEAAGGDEGDSLGPGVSVSSGAASVGVAVAVGMPSQVTGCAVPSPRASTTSSKLNAGSPAAMPCTRIVASTPPPLAASAGASCV